MVVFMPVTFFPAAPHGKEKASDGLFAGKNIDQKC